MTAPTPARSRQRLQMGHGKRITTTMLTSGAFFALLLAEAMLPVKAAETQPAEIKPAETPAASAPATHAVVAGSPESGERVFLKCRACHQVGEGAKHTVGPQLNGVAGRKAGVVAGYSFSAPMKNSGLTWNDATLREYLKNPRAMVQGTRMFIPGIHKDKEFQDLLAYLKQFDAAGKKTP